MGSTEENPDPDYRFIVHTTVVQVKIQSLCYMAINIYPDHNVHYPTFVRYDKATKDGNVKYEHRRILVALRSPALTSPPNPKYPYQPNVHIQAHGHHPYLPSHQLSHPHLPFWVVPHNQEQYT